MIIKRICIVTYTKRKFYKHVFKIIITKVVKQFLCQIGSVSGTKFHKVSEKGAGRNMKTKIYAKEIGLLKRRTVFLQRR